MKTLCDYTRKEIEENLEQLAEMIYPPRYLCRKCARSAKHKKMLCKPVRAFPPGRESKM